MKEIINNREVQIVEYNTARNWYKEMPNQNWLCVLVVNEKHRRYIDEVISKILNRDVCYFCAIGNQGKEVHNLIEEEITYREVEIEQIYIPKHDIIVTWHNEFEKGIRFAIFEAFHEAIEIKNVTILDITDGREVVRIQALLLKIKNEN